MNSPVSPLLCRPSFQGRQEQVPSTNLRILRPETVLRVAGDRVDGGSSQSPVSDSSFHQNAQPVSPISRDSWSWAREDTNIGRCSPSSFARRLLRPSRESLERNVMPSLPAPKPPKSTSGKKRPGLPVPSLNLESDLFGGTPRGTGIPFGQLHQTADCLTLKHRYEYSITARSEPSLLIIATQHLWSDFASFSGGQLVLESRDLPGSKEDLLLTLRIPGQSSGVAIKVREMVYLINVVILDEFRGDIDISHLLRWLDRYPVIVELKGSSAPLVAEKIWITSNLHPSSWYPLLDAATYAALERRLQITHMQ